MSDLNSARRRLEEALTRLEGAIASLPAPSEGEAGLVRELEALRAECDRLNAALAEARREQEEARSVSDEVAERLNGTIADIDSILET